MSRVFEVEHEFLDFAQGDANVVFRAALHGRLQVDEHGPQLFGVLVVGIGFEALGLGDQGLGGFDSLAKTGRHKVV